LKNKNLKNPLLLSVTYGLHAALKSMRLKARFHASPEAIMALLAKHRQQQRKTPFRFAPLKKQRIVAKNNLSTCQLNGK
jgi:hypothetical protein